MDKLSPELELLAQRELGETPQVRMDAVAQLRTLIAAETDLSCPTDEAFLVKFLRARKYRVEETFSTILKYFQVRQVHKDVFEDLLPSRIMFNAIFQQHRLATVLEERDHLGRLIVIMKLGAWKPHMCPVNELFRAGLVVCEHLLLNEATQIAGIVAVVDLEGLSLEHLLHYTPSQIKKLIQLVQECYPLRVKGIYVINNPPVFEFIFSVVKLFLKQKLMDRVHLLGRDCEKLHALIPRELLPVEYGGTQSQQNYDSFEKSLQGIEDFCVKMGHYGYETKPNKDRR